MNKRIETLKIVSIDLYFSIFIFCNKPEENLRVQYFNRLRGIHNENYTVKRHIG